MQLEQGCSWPAFLFSLCRWNAIRAQQDFQEYDIKMFWFPVEGRACQNLERFGTNDWRTGYPFLLSVETLKKLLDFEPKMLAQLSIAALRDTWSSWCVALPTPFRKSLWCPTVLLQLGHAPSRKLDEMSRVHAVVNSSSLCFLSRCCRCYWCRVALGLPPCFRFPNKSNINQVELVRISKGLEQMIGERATP